MSSNPARWHADPSGRHELRYWDGNAWTDHVSDHGVTSRDPVTGGSTGSADATLMPSSEGRSTPARREPLRVEGGFDPVDRSSNERVARRGPRPIVQQAGWSSRTKLLVAFVLVDIVAIAVIVYLVTG